MSEPSVDELQVSLRELLSPHILICLMNSYDATMLEINIAAVFGKGSKFRGTQSMDVTSSTCNSLHLKGVKTVAQ